MDAYSLFASTVAADTSAGLVSGLMSDVSGLTSRVGSASDAVFAIDSAVDNRKRDKRNAAWEAERQQLEKDRAIREVEYHEARMKEIDRK